MLQTSYVCCFKPVRGATISIYNNKKVFLKYLIIDFD